MRVANVIPIVRMLRASASFARGSFSSSGTGSGLAVNDADGAIAKHRGLAVGGLDLHDLHVMKSSVESLGGLYDEKAQRKKQLIAQNAAANRAAHESKLQSRRSEDMSLKNDHWLPSIPQNSTLSSQLPPRHKSMYQMERPPELDPTPRESAQRYSGRESAQRYSGMTSRESAQRYSGMTSRESAQRYSGMTSRRLSALRTSHEERSLKVALRDDFAIKSLEARVSSGYHFGPSPSMRPKERAATFDGQSLGLGMPRHNAAGSITNKKKHHF